MPIAVLCDVIQDVCFSVKDGWRVDGDFRSAAVLRIERAAEAAVVERLTDGALALGVIADASIHAVDFGADRNPVVVHQTCDRPILKLLDARLMWLLCGR